MTLCVNDLGVKAFKKIRWVGVGKSGDANLTIGKGSRQAAFEATAPDKAASKGKKRRDRSTYVWLFRVYA